MNELSKVFKSAVHDLVRRYTSDEVSEVVSWEEVTESSGYCDTCYYETVRVEIIYLTSDGERKSFRYHANFSELLSELLRED